jgi:histidine triad (HIT) family protein
MTDQCLFCKIIHAEISAEKVYEDKYVIGFKDINPKAPVHILLIPKKHLDNILGFQEEDTEILAAIFKGIKVIAKEQGIADSGFRVVVNNGEQAGQAVEHVHFHILGGRALSWPPG